LKEKLEKTTAHLMGGVASAEDVSSHQCHSYSTSDVSVFQKMKAVPNLYLIPVGVEEQKGKPRKKEGEIVVGVLKGTALPDGVKINDPIVNTLEGSPDQKKLQKCDVFVCDNGKQTISWQLHALAAGCFVITPRIGYAPWFIIQGKNGLIVDSPSTDLKLDRQRLQSSTRINDQVKTLFQADVIAQRAFITYILAWRRH